MKSFEILLGIINAALDVLNKNGYHIRDNVNEEYYISEVYYDSVNDEIYYDTEEEVIPRWSVDSGT